MADFILRVQFFEVKNTCTHAFGELISVSLIILLWVTGF